MFHFLGVFQLIRKARHHFDILYLHVKGPEGKDDLVSTTLEVGSIQVNSGSEIPRWLAYIGNRVAFNDVHFIVCLNKVSSLWVAVSLVPSRNPEAKVSGY